MGIFTKKSSGLADSKDSKFHRSFIMQTVFIVFAGITGSPLAAMYFLLPRPIDMSNIINDIASMDMLALFKFLIAGLFLTACLWLMTLNKYYINKGSRRGEEHGSSKLMTNGDMPAFRQGFYFDPVIVARCKGYEKVSKKTYFSHTELKKMLKNTLLLELESRLHPLKPLKSKSERRKYKDSPNYQCFFNSQIMAQGVYVSMNCKYINRNLNTITIGGSGQGKSFSELFPNVMLANANYVITDPSGEILQKCGKFLRRQGYCIKVFNIKDFDYSMRYNPLMYIEDEKDINVLVDALNKNIDDSGVKTAGSNDFFEKAQRSLTAALFSALREIYPNNPEKQTLFNVMQLLRMAEQKTDKQTGEQYSELDGIFNGLKEKNPRSYAVKMYENFKVGGPKVCGSVIISATAVFGRFFDNDSMAKLIEADDLNLYDFVTGIDENNEPLKCALFLIIPQDTSTYNFMVSMIYSQLFSIATKGGEKWRLKHNTDNPALPRHLSFWLDEFANIGKIPSFLEILSVVRKYNISINIIVQALSQPKAIYKDEWETILGNTDTMIYLGGQEPSTVKQMSEKLGKETIKTHSQSQNGNKSSSQSQQTTGRELMTASEIEQISRAYELVFITGCKPFMARKYDLTKHPNYKYFGEANPKKNNLNITEFAYVAEDGQSGKQFRSIPMWYKTGKKDDFGIDIMKIKTVKEPLLCEHDRITRIDGNTINLDDIYSAIKSLPDKVFDISKKTASAKAAWISAEKSRKNADKALAEILSNLKEANTIYTEFDADEAKDALKNAYKNSIDKHISYLKYQQLELKSLLSRKKIDDTEYAKLIKANQTALDDAEKKLEGFNNGDEIKLETEVSTPVESLDGAVIISSEIVNSPDLSMPKELKVIQDKTLKELEQSRFNEDLENAVIDEEIADIDGYDPYADFDIASEDMFENPKK